MCCEWALFKRVKFQQTTWPRNSDIDEMVTNDIKMGKIPTGTWPTFGNAKQLY